MSINQAARDALEFNQWVVYMRRQGWAIMAMSPETLKDTGYEAHEVEDIVDDYLFETIFSE